MFNLLPTYSDPRLKFFFFIITYEYRQLYLHPAMKCSHSHVSICVAADSWAYTV
jgi:hypothetical protein